MRLVDADALDNMLAYAQTECKRNGGNFWFGALSTVRENIKTIPAVDAVPVVRCRDCKYWFGGDDDMVHSCELDALLRPAGWYCAGGERRDDGATD